MKINSLKEKP